MQKLKLRHATRQEKVVIIVATFIFLVHSVACLFPAVYAFFNAFKTAEEYFTNPVAPPSSLSFYNFVRVFSEFTVRSGQYGFFDMAFNSLWILVVCVFVNVMSSLLLAYGLAKFRFPGAQFLYGVVIFANTVPIIGSGPAGFKMMNALGMINNPFLIWLSWAGGFDMAFIIFYGTFKGISHTYSEAAEMDGANSLTVLFKIVMPQAFPSVVAICITQAIGVWNNYSISMIYMREYPTLAYGLYIFNTSDMYYVENSVPIFFAAAIFSCLPVIILYSCNQKLILTNMTVGGLKG